MLKILVATTNKGKVKELQEVLNKLPIKIVSLEDFQDEIPLGFAVIENGKTFVENAEIKSKAYGEQFKILTIADDSGLEVKALNGRPGVFSKRYGNSDAERNERLLKELQKIPESERSARFICVLSIYDANTKEFHNVKGLMQGRISDKPKGDHGFGYDPIFVNETGKTNAELILKKKNEISHRGKALRELKEYLEEKYQL